MVWAALAFAAQLGAASAAHGCEVAEAVLDDAIAGGEKVFAEFDLSAPDKNFVAEAWSDTSPASPLRLAQIANLKKNAIAACPGLKAKAAAAGRVLAPSDLQAGSKGPRVMYVMISLPVFAVSGREAFVMETAEHMGVGLGGGGDLLILHRLNGRWTVIARRNLYLS